MAENVPTILIVDDSSLVCMQLKKFFEENCLMEQGFVKEPKTSIGDLAKELSGSIGEKVEVRRFERYVLGEGIEKEVVDFADEVAQAVQDSQ